MHGYNMLFYNQTVYCLFIAMFISLKYIFDFEPLNCEILFIKRQIFAYMSFNFKMRLLVIDST